MVKTAGQPTVWEQVKEPSAPEPSFLRSPGLGLPADMTKVLSHVATLIPQSSRTVANEATEEKVGSLVVAFRVFLASYEREWSR